MPQAQTMLTKLGIIFIERVYLQNKYCTRSVICYALPRPRAMPLVFALPVPVPRPIPLTGRRVVVVDDPRAPVRLVLTLGVLPSPVLRTVPRAVPLPPLVFAARRLSSSSALRAAASRCCWRACSRRSAACCL